ncbi:MAG: 50S ribosomal protein L4 [Bacillota bacterium]|nr:50S ribosomal protein L4 [Negativicutes bacterium]
MPKVAMYNTAGQQTGEIELKDSIFGVEVNEAVLHQAVVLQLANQRLGTHKTKTRAEVRGGGRKPWKQKGTGRARSGSIRSPLWVGGGTVFGPQPRSYKKTLPRKVRRLALKSALSSKVENGNLIVLEGLQMAAPKTKEMATVLKNLNFADTKTLIVAGEEDANVVKSTDNIPGVKTVTTTGLNVYDILHYTKLVLLKDVVGTVEEVWA